MLPLLPLVVSAVAVAAGAVPPVDNSAFGALLAAHVHGGRVDYQGFAGSPAFADYLARLASAQPETLTTAERLAFWINAYNAWTIELVNRHGRPGSIREIRHALDGAPLKDAWSEPIVRAAGRTMTLDELEHGVLGSEFHEPRVHFALVCAALGCPPLRAEAYSGPRLEHQLDDQTRVFLGATPAKNRVDVATATVFVSPILVWYRNDFGGSDAAIGRFLARYWRDGPEKDLLLTGRYQLRETAYDWGLNDVRSKAVPPR
jgi:hypothetical protein